MASASQTAYLADVRKGMSTLARGLIRLGNEVAEANSRLSAFSLFASAAAADRWVHPPVKMNSKRQRRH